MRDAIGRRGGRSTRIRTRTIGDARVGRDGDRRARVDVEDGDDGDGRRTTTRRAATRTTRTTATATATGDGDARTGEKAGDARNRAGARGATR